ncbi:MAG: inorganic phosphate transporter [Microvirga sp.]|nr:inorganic phosphate transporter [Microvirga sp.]
MAKSSLDKDLGKVDTLQTATYSLSRNLATPGLLLVFFIGAITVASLSVVGGPLSYLVIAGAVVAAYMALNIGANDVANNMGPAVGSRALSLGGALVIAAFCEVSGAVLAGGDVVSTISSSLLSPPETVGALQFILVMMAALLAAAMWIHLATYLSAPVSTTHSVVGGVVGAGVAAFGFGAVSWTMIGAIVASWVISPALGGLIAAALLGFVKWTILFRDDRIEAARRWVPVMVGLMTGVFAMYLSSKGFSRVWRPSAVTVLALGCVFFGLGYAMSRPWVRRRSVGMENRRKYVAGLFTAPLVLAAALLSFAHGANDVANAVGPLAAIVAAAETGGVDVARVALPMWILVIGAVGIAVGLGLFGPRLIRMVGEKITRMDAIRAFCVALAAAITVLVASALGLPVSSTHIAIGAIFGVGFLREFITNKGVRNPAVQPRTLFLDVSRLNKTAEEAVANAVKRERRRLVRRQHLAGIAAAWVITVPAAGVLAGCLYFVLSIVAEF